MTAADDSLRRMSDRLADILTRIAASANTVRSVGFRIPELDADPAGDDPTNAWILADGRLRFRTSDGTVHEFLDVAASRPQIPTFSADPSAGSGWKAWVNGGTGKLRVRMANGTIENYSPDTTNTSSDGGTGSPGGGTSTITKPPDPNPGRHTARYKAQWAQIYCQAHGIETGDHLHYGRFSGVHGERKIMIGFDDAQIRTDLAGSEVKQVQLRMLNTNSWAYAGISVHFGAHNQHTAPAAYSATRRGVYVGDWPQSGWGGGKDHWRTVPTWYGTSLRDNTIKGLTIDQPTGVTSYGEMDWSSVELQITTIV